MGSSVKGETMNFLLRLLGLALAVSVAECFRADLPPAFKPSGRLVVRRAASNREETFDPLGLVPVSNDHSGEPAFAVATATGLAAVASLGLPQEALAKGGEYGLCE